MKLSEILPEVNKKVITIEIWEEPEYRARDMYFIVDSELLDFLSSYLEKGIPPSKIRNGLEKALQDCPALAGAALEELNHRQRENVVGSFLISLGNRLEPDLDLTVHLF